MSDWPPKTFRRLAGEQLVAFAVAILILAGLSFAAARHQLDRSLERDMERRAQIALHVQRAGGQSRMLGYLDKRAQEGSHLGYVLTGPRGERLKGPGPVPPLAPGWGMLKLYDPDEERIDPFRTLTVPLSDGGALTILADRDFVQAFDTWIWLFGALSIVLLIVFAFVGRILLERRVRHRLASVNATARAIMEGDLNKRLYVQRQGRDELDLLSTTVNAMLDRMHSYLQELRMMSSYITHDLREPLASLASDLRRHQMSRQTPAECRPIFGEAADKCEGMINLFGQILQIGDVNAMRVRTAGGSFDLSELVLLLAEDHVPVAEDGGHSLVVDVEPAIPMFGMRELIAQALVNLIANALRHTPAGTHISVTLRRYGASALLAVGDDGPSFPASERAGLLEENRRSAGELRRKAIGLKLARAIAIAHGGTLALIDNRPGLLVEITLPLPA